MYLSDNIEVQKCGLRNWGFTRSLILVPVACIFIIERLFPFQGHSWRLLRLYVGIILFLSPFGTYAVDNPDAVAFLQKAKPMLEGLTRIEIYFIKDAKQFPRVGQLKDKKGDLITYNYFKSDGTNYFWVWAYTPFTITNLTATDGIFGRHGDTNGDILWMVDSDAHTLTKFVNAPPLPFLNARDFSPKYENLYYGLEEGATEPLRLGIVHSIPFSFSVSESNKFTAKAIRGGEIVGTVERGLRPEDLFVKYIRKTDGARFLIRLTDSNGFASTLPSIISTYNGNNPNIQQPTVQYFINQVKYFQQDEAVLIPGPDELKPYYASTAVLSNSEYYVIQRSNALVLLTSAPLTRKDYIPLYTGYAFIIVFAVCFSAFFFLAKKRLRKQKEMPET